VNQIICYEWDYVRNDRIADEIDKAENCASKQVITEISANVQELAATYGVGISRDIVNETANEGWSAGRDIHLGEFDDPDLELVAFFHELGHILSEERVCKRGSTLTVLSAEGLAWELGLGIAFEHGYKWKRDSKEMKYARHCLMSYIDNDATKLDIAEAR